MIMFENLNLSIEGSKYLYICSFGSIEQINLPRN